MTPLFPSWTVAFGFILGAFFGSFLNMVIYRLPRNLSFTDPSRSFCPNCRHPLEAMDLIPILSWLMAGGKCRHCRQPIAVRYLTVELVTGCAFAGVWWRFLLNSAEPPFALAGIMAATVAILVAIVYIDAELFIIPDELNAILLGLGIGLAFLTKNWTGFVSGYLWGWGLLWGFQLVGRVGFGKDALGDGDIKMMRGVGTLLGPLLLGVSFGVAVFLGLIGGIAGLLIAGRASKATGSPEPSSAEVSDEGAVDWPPTPIRDVLYLGVIYLLSLDVLALFSRKFQEVLVRPLSEQTKATEEVDDNWTPSVTTIPFGPYLAAGALLCVIFGPQLEGAVRGYFKGNLGMTVRRNIEGSGRKGEASYIASASSLRLSVREQRTEGRSL